MSPKSLRGPGSRAVIAAVTKPIDRHMLPNIDDTLVGVTHRADRWERDVDGTLVLVLEPRGGRVDGGSVA